MSGRNGALTFSKMVAAGNDFVVVDALIVPSAQAALSRLARRMCDRRYGIGSDGLLVMGKRPGVDLTMRIFNPDGSEAEMCGNGIRCAALWGVQRSGRRRGTLTIDTRAGQLTTTVDGSTVSVRLGDADAGCCGADYRVTVGEPVRLSIGGRRVEIVPVNSGVPHAVVFTAKLEREPVEDLGRAIRWHRRFAPAGTNVDFVQRTGRLAIRQRTYERGVEEETLACGTGAIASAVASVWQVAKGARRERHVISVMTQSGERLIVRFRLAGAEAREVELEGAARVVYEGRLSDV